MRREPLIDALASDDTDGVGTLLNGGCVAAGIGLLWLGLKISAAILVMFSLSGCEAVRRDVRWFLRHNEVSGTVFVERDGNRLGATVTSKPTGKHVVPTAPQK